jgi:putative salt-induced outer membrane protein YdiY
MSVEMNRSYLSLLPFSLAALMALSPSALADRVHLEDGSRIEGRLQRLHEKALAVDTAFAGTISIAQDKIAGLNSDGFLMISLASGDRIMGRLAYDPQTGQRLLSESLGNLPLDLGDVSAIWPEDQPTPETLVIQEIEERERRNLAEAQTQHEEEKKALAEALVTPDKAWSGRTQLGLSGASGNTDRAALNGRASARRETSFDRLDLSLGWRFARENGRETENEVIGNARLERDFSDRWFAFGSIMLEQDEFENLDLRSVLTLGSGYFFIQEKDHELKARLGLGYQVEAFQTSPTEEEAVLSFGYDYKIQLNGRLLFTHNFTYLPSLSDPVNDFRLQSDAALDIPVTDNKAWTVKIGLRNQYDNRPVLGNEKLDTFYTVSLGYNFQ